MMHIIARARYGAAGERNRERLAAILSEADDVPAVLPASTGLAERPTPRRVGGAAPVRSVHLSVADRFAMERVRERVHAYAVVEEAIGYEKLGNASCDLLRTAPLDLQPTLRAEPIAAAGTDRTLSVTVKGRRRSHVPLEGAEVHVFLQAGFGLRDRMVARTDGKGTARFRFSARYDVLAVFAAPYGEYWPQKVRGVTTNRVELLCEPLPDGPTHWWHKAHGLGPDAEEIPVSVGVVDSGCGPHPALEHVNDLGAVIDGAPLANGADTGTHGTHVCGTIGARPAPRRGGTVWGAAPGAAHRSMRVFDAASPTANQGDIADAIDTLVLEAGVDLINLSLGGARSLIIEDAIANATANGVLCVCAAGNDGGPVTHPAAGEFTVAVAAIGKLGFVPDSADPALPGDPRLYGRFPYHSADFSNFGDAVNVCAPGVGVTATVPARFGQAAPYAAMNGTSMAAPCAVETLATLLGRDEGFAAMPRNRERARYARVTLLAAARSIDLPRSHEGSGLPQAR